MRQAELNNWSLDAAQMADLCSSINQFFTATGVIPSQGAAHPQPQVQHPTAPGAPQHPAQPHRAMHPKASQHNQHGQLSQHNQHISTGQYNKHDKNTSNNVFLQEADKNRMNDGRKMVRLPNVTYVGLNKAFWRIWDHSILTYYNALIKIKLHQVKPEHNINFWPVATCSSLPFM